MQLNAFRDRISDMAKSNYFGFDINPDLVKATKMNMVMNNDGSGNILQTIHCYHRMSGQRIFALIYLKH